MKFTQHAFDLILSNKVLRLKIALALDLNEQSIITSAKRKSDSLQKYHSVELLKKHGLTIDEIFEKKIPAASIAV